MLENELQEYTALNSIAEKGGIVLFGGKEDKTIPLCELKQAFSLPNIYNRSLDEFWLQNAVEYYDLIVAPLAPKYLFIHVSEIDVKLFQTAPMTFDNALRALIAHVRAQNKNCTIALISVKNLENTNVLTEINTHLKNLADSERLEFSDVSKKKVWNPKTMKEVIGFISCMGITKRPIYDVIKILYQFNQPCNA